MKTKLFFLVAFVVGTLVPGYFILLFIIQNGFNVGLFVSGLFQNHASTTFSLDLLICSFVFWVWIWKENGFKFTPSVMLYITLNLSIGLSSALPLYFFNRKA